MRIIDSHTHIGDIFHERKNITFKTNIHKGDYDDPFIQCERSGYTSPLFPPEIMSDPEKVGPFVYKLIKSGQYRCWEWTLENLTRELDAHPEVKYTVMLPMKRFVKCFFVFIDIFIILEYDLYNKSYFGGE